MGARTLSMSFWATLAAPSGGVSGRRTRNSSPPRRASESPSRRPSEALPHDLEHLVPGGMAERVVDDLEAVEVHEKDAQGRVAALGLGERVGEAVLEEEPVGQAGEAVVEGHVLDLVFLALAVDRFRDVMRHVVQQVPVGLGVADLLAVALHDEDAEGGLPQHEGHADPAHRGGTEDRAARGAPGVDLGAIHQQRPAVLEDPAAEGGLDGHAQDRGVHLVAIVREGEVLAG
ncbi:MAG TPA: hypothetical protein PKU70_03170 [Vicinamibacteria bacterium]|nr:hypothetical protein [Vicinamibacteria bacterium]